MFFRDKTVFIVEVQRKILIAQETCFFNISFAYDHKHFDLPSDCLIKTYLRAQSNYTHTVLLLK